MLNIEPCHDPYYHLREVTQDAGAYFLREGEAPGRWRGMGASALGLAGEVTPQALHDLFHGKNPTDGAYLISSRGSAARATARARDTTLDVPAVAARLGLIPSAVRSRLRAGGIKGAKQADGSWRVSIAAIDAYQNDIERWGRRRPSFASDKALSLADAARLAGVTRSYLARLVTEDVPGVTQREDGRPIQYIVGTRDERGHWRIAPGELDRFMASRQPPNAVPAYDLALRAPKSVSVLHALGHLVPTRTLDRLGLPSNVAQEIVEAHHAAVDDTIGFLERHAAWIRGPGGRVQATGLTVAVFDHRSSRTGDPLLHSHAVIANVAAGVDGRRAALDGTALYAWARAGGHVYQARLRAELVERLGVRFEQPHNGLADIAGLPRELIEHFSDRRREILALMNRLGMSGAAGAQRAALATRRPKGDHSHQSPEVLADRAAALGIGPNQLAAVVGHGPVRPLEQSDMDRIDAHLASPEGLTARATRVDLRDAVCGFATELVNGATAADIERWATGLLRDSSRFVPVIGGPIRGADVIRRTDGRTVRVGGVDRTYATPELLAHEAHVVAAHADGLGPDGNGIGVGVATPESLADALAARPTLRREQVEMVRRITTSGIGVEVVVGGPGSGKTFALGAAADAWRASGFRVLGASLQGGAADALAREADLDEQYTITALLVQCRRQGSGHLHGSVVMVDEAGMADTRQLSQLARYAAASDCKLVLVGDPDQIPEVGAGGAFGHLVDRLGSEVVAVRENHRQVHAGDRDRLSLIRQGRAAEAIASAQAAGRWHEAASADEVRESLLRAWADDPGGIAKDKFMVATTVAEVEWLNRAARAVLRASGHLGDDAVTIRLSSPDRAVDRRELRTGDRVRAARNDWQQRVFTGMVGTIVSVDTRSQAVDVRFDRDIDDNEGRVITLGRAFLNEAERQSPSGKTTLVAPGLTHAYASTANGVQGRTSDRVYFLLAEAGLHRQAAFTAASRARQETHFYGLTVPDADEMGLHSRPSLTPEDERPGTYDLERAMGRDASQTMASLADPMAAEIGDLMGRPPAWLWEERKRIAESIAAGPPLRVSLLSVRRSLVDAFGLDRRDLECPQLTRAMVRALRVPGATPDRLADIMTSRTSRGPRELLSARDPVAVLVWAAGDLAVKTFEQEASRRKAGTSTGGTDAPTMAATRRLSMLDAAIARQREARLALAEVESASQVVVLVGSPPDHPAAMVPWRRAAAAIADYRDAAGIFDRPLVLADPWTHALGHRPEGPIARLYDETRTIVVEARADILLAEIARNVPVLGSRPSVDLETLAQRPLRVLERELADLHRLSADREVLDEYLGPTGAAQPPPTAGRWARRTDAALLAARAETEPGPEPRMRAVADAIDVRSRRLRAAVVTDPPAWVRRDVASRASTEVPTPELGRRLAAAYGSVAVHADRSGRGIEVDRLEDALGSRPIEPRLLRSWEAAHEALAMVARPDLASGVDLELGL